jgi:integrase
VAKGKEQRYRANADPRARRATVNRMWSIFRAALNRAYEDGHVPHHDAWRRVPLFKGTTQVRDRILTEDETTRFLNACRPDFPELAKAAVLTGARYGELRRLVVEDFNPEGRNLRVGVSKNGKGRYVVLPRRFRVFRPYGP